MPDPTPVIIDTDPGIDDAMAILFAARSKAIELLGLTTTFGNARLDQTTRNALLLRDRFELGCPVHQGAAAPLVVPMDPPADFVHGADGLGEAGFEPPPLPADAGDAIQFLIDSARARPGEITLIAVGRLTNLALALARAPDIESKFRSIVIMGGSINRSGVGGNVTPVAEANIHGDPHAADRVFRASWPLTMVGLDVTMRTVMTPAQVEHLRERGGDAGDFIARITRFYEAFYRSSHGVPGFAVHDSSAVARVVAPELFNVESGGLRVITDGPAYGQTVLVPQHRGWADEHWMNLPSHDVCVDVNADAVLELYLDTLIDG